MINYLEEKAIISEQIIGGIDELLSRSKEIVFGGSIALNAVGLIKRQVKDIDIFTHCAWKLNHYNLLSLVCPTSDVKDISETATDVNGEQIRRVGAKINGINVCIFILNKPPQFSEFKFLGRTIKIQNVNDAILAKRAYSEMNLASCDKHRQDLIVINKSLDDGLPF